MLFLETEQEGNSDMIDTVKAKRVRSVAIARASKKGRKFVRRSFKPIESIKPDEVYAFELIPERLGIGRVTLRKAERDGLETYKIGGRKFVEGRQLISYLKRNCKT